MLLIIFKFLLYIFFGKSIEDQMVDVQLKIDISKKMIKYNEEYLDNLSNSVKLGIFEIMQDVRRAICSQEISLLKHEAELIKLQLKR